MNVMDINGYKAVISYDPDINLFRGEFIELNGGADFYAADVDTLRQEGETSLQVFLDLCREKGLEPRRSFSGKFNVRISPELHARLALEAMSVGKSLNAVVADKLAA
ncbi:MAG: type II toxin-antitoxin system HicB family antitoxin [Betaproteobacteria bacterium]|nr:type II toxin-antitoxin system HicB family antitoxin [Betaproteobacteria bacterium]